MSRIVSRKCHGTDLAAIARLRKAFDSDCDRFDRNDLEQADLAAAVGYLIGYPSFLELIGHNWQANATRAAAYYSLNCAHIAAVTILMREAERSGLDSGPLWEYGRICRELFAAEPERYYVGEFDTWPECLGRTRKHLSPDYRDSIREGEITLRRLNARLDIDSAKAVGKRGRKPSPNIDPRRDQQIAEAVEQTRSRKEVARIHHISVKDVKLAQDRGQVPIRL